MSTHTDQTHQPHRTLSSRESVHNQNSSAPSLQLASSHPDIAALQQQQILMNNSAQTMQLSALQNMVNNSQQAENSAQLQAIMHNYSMQPLQAIQKKDAKNQACNFSANPKNLHTTRTATNNPQNSSHIIQRAVQKTEEGFFTDLEPTRKFQTEEEAYDYEYVLSEIEEMSTDLDSPLGQNLAGVERLHQKLSGNLGAQGGIASALQGNNRPAWIPAPYWPSVKARFNLLKTKAQTRKAPGSSYTTWNEAQCLAEVQKLDRDQYSGAQLLSKSVTDAFAMPGDDKWPIISGWRFQIFQSVQYWSQYNLLAIEIGYGGNQGQGKYMPRADLRLADGTFVDFKAASQSKKTSTDVEYKRFWAQFERYAGVNDNAYGVTGPMRYVFSNAVPGWIADEIQARAKAARTTRSTAFPQGLFLNNQRILNVYDIDEKIQQTKAQVLGIYTQYYSTDPEVTQRSQDYLDFLLEEEEINITHEYQQALHSDGDVQPIVDKINSGFLKTYNTLKKEKVATHNYLPDFNEILADAKTFYTMNVSDNKNKIMATEIDNYLETLYDKTFEPFQSALDIMQPPENDIEQAAFDKLIHYTEMRLDDAIRDTLQPWAKNLLSNPH